MKSRYLLVLASLFISHISHATPCDDARKDFNRAKKFGAYEFKCQDRYDGSATSSWKMDSESFKAFKASEVVRNRKKIKGK